jgi:hypothetical protein
MSRRSPLELNGIHGHANLPASPLLLFMSSSFLSSSAVASAIPAAELAPRHHFFTWLPLQVFRGELKVVVVTSLPATLPSTRNRWSTTASGTLYRVHPVFVGPAGFQIKGKMISRFLVMV